jgi:hypothetical protein
MVKGRDFSPLQARLRVGLEGTTCLRDSFLLILIEPDRLRDSSGLNFAPRMLEGPLSTHCGNSIVDTPLSETRAEVSTHCGPSARAERARRRGRLTGRLRYGEAPGHGGGGLNSSGPASETARDSGNHVTATPSGAARTRAAVVLNVTLAVMATEVESCTLDEVESCDPFSSSALPLGRNTRWAHAARSKPNAGGSASIVWQ